jgi:hypothetical protein
MTMTARVDRIQFGSIPIDTVETATPTNLPRSAQPLNMGAPLWPTLLLTLGGVLTLAWTAALVLGVSYLASSIMQQIL